MSVTFYPEIRDGDHEGYELRCSQGTLIETLAPSVAYGEAKRRADLHGDVCDFCYGIGAEIVEVTQVPSVNVSQNNGSFLLGLLGYDDQDLSGEATPSDFLACLRLARGSAEGYPYVALKFDQLTRVARWSEDHGRQVCWA